MAAVYRGTKAAGGQTIGILPGADAAAADPWVDTRIVTGMGEARNAIVECHTPPDCCQSRCANIFLS